MTTTEMALAEQTTALEREVSALLQQVERKVVETDDDYEQMVGWAQRGRRMVKAAKELMDPIVTASRKAWQTALKQQALLVDPGEAIVKAADRKALDYHTRREEARLAAERARQAELEAAEAAAQAAAEAQERELQREAETARLEQAAEAEAAGDRETADRLLEAPVVVPTVVPAIPVLTTSVPPAAPKIPGWATRRQWKAELQNLDDVIRAAAAGNTLARSFLGWNQSAADGVARSTRGAVTVPGVTFRETTTATGRS